jgi:DNA-binding transcriptional LysR family regulator
LEDFFSRRNLPLNLAGEMDSVDAIKEVVKHSHAIAFLPEWCIASELRSQSLCSLPLGTVQFNQSWGMMHLRGHPLNHPESTLLKLCRQQARKMGNLDGPASR